MGENTTEDGQLHSSRHAHPVRNSAGLLPAGAGRVLTGALLFAAFMPITACRDEVEDMLPEPDRSGAVLSPIPEERAVTGELLEPIDLDVPDEGGRSSVGGVSWVLPAGWAEAPSPGSMRLATWDLPHDGAGPANCILFRFPGGGDPRANINRWISQFEQPDGADTIDRAEAAERSVAGNPAWFVRTRGTYVSRGASMQGPEQRHEGYALFGAIVQGPGDPVFLKCTGPAEVIESESGRAAAFVDSLQITAL